MILFSVVAAAFDVINMALVMLTHYTRSFTWFEVWQWAYLWSNTSLTALSQVRVNSHGQKPRNPGCMRGKMHGKPVTFNFKTNVMWNVMHLQGILTNQV